MPNDRSRMGDRSVETPGSKMRFLSVLVTFSPLPPKAMLIFLFLRLHRPQRLHNIELGGRGIRELTLDANKIEQMLKYRKASFPKSVSTAFVAHCRQMNPYISWVLTADSTHSQYCQYNRFRSSMSYYILIY